MKVNQAIVRLIKSVNAESTPYPYTAGYRKGNR